MEIQNVEWVMMNVEWETRKGERAMGDVEWEFGIGNRK